MSHFRNMILFNEAEYHLENYEDLLNYGVMKIN